MTIKPPQAPKAPKADMSLKREAELQMWHDWNNSGRKPAKIEPLLASFKPLIESRAYSYKNRVEIPTAAIDAEYQKQFVNALKTYNPEKGRLSSWVYGNLAKASRYIKTYQNVGKIPEERIGAITPYKQAYAELSDKLGTEPDSLSLAQHLKWPLKRVVTLQKEMREDLPVSGWEKDPYDVMASSDLETLRLVQYELSPEERTVYEYTFGMNGKPSLSPGDIAKKTKMHPSRVSRIRSKVRKLVLEASED